MRKITLVMKNNKKEKVDVVRYFQLNQGKYLIYTLGEVDQNDYQTLYVAREMEELGSPILQTIRDEDDWNNLKQQIREMIKELKRGAEPTFTDLNSTSLDGLYIADARVFKLAKPIVEILTIQEEPTNEEPDRSELEEIQPVSMTEEPTETVVEPVLEERPVVPNAEIAMEDEVVPPTEMPFPSLEESELPLASSNETEVVTPVVEPVPDTAIAEEEVPMSNEQPTETSFPEVEEPVVTEIPVEPVMDTVSIPSMEEMAEMPVEESKKSSKKKFKPTEEVNMDDQPFNRYILEVPPVPENVPIISLEEVYATLQKEMEQLKAAIEEALQNKANLESVIVSLRAENAGQVSQIQAFKEENNNQASAIASFKEETARQTAEINSLTSKNVDQAAQIEKLNAEIKDYESKFKNIKGIID